HPKLEPILRKTYGVAVYQEQVMQIARDLAGFSLGEADMLRKAMGKKIFALIHEQKIKFIEGCVTQGVDRKIGEKVFEYIEPFAGYGFNRSHAACYGLIGYQTAYLKAHFPAPFMAALLTSDQDNIDRIAIEVSECREMGIEVMAPHINESFEEFAVIVDEETKKSRIRFGLNAIKNVGHNVAHEIVEERKKNGKFKSLADLVERVQTKDLNKKSIEALAKVGALEGFGERNQIIASIENIITHSKTFQKNQNSQQFSLFGASEIAMPQIALLECEPATKKQRLSWEKELMGLYISDHPAREYKDYFAQMGVPIKNINASHVGQNISVGGVIAKIHKIYLKTQKTMLFVTIEDMDGAMEILVFPKVLDATGAVWEEDKVVLASGKISDKDGNFKILCDSVTVVNQAEVEKFSRILATRKLNEKPVEKKADATKLIITLPGSADKDTLKKLSQYFDRCDAGALKIYLAINNQKLETPYCITQSDNLETNLKNIIPEAKISIF
ncbi:MAG: OB-fold nucleic acid binding domain-containing protein, partial [Candidatus Moranbacteria bacterium]|nr:OB-fold nucleic acid binding domain-containing protein [Candidatus Moranbacteria bacterium]